MQYYDAALDSYGTIGPMGSNHSLIYLSAAEIHSKLNDPTCSIRRDFEKKQLGSWKDSIDIPQPEFSIGEEYLPVVEKSIFPWEKCSSCKSKRTAILKDLVLLRHSLRNEFAQREGAEIGITVGICEGGRKYWFDIFFFRKLPERFFCFPIQSSDISLGHTASTDFGELIIPLETNRGLCFSMECVTGK